MTNAAPTWEVTFAQRPSRMHNWTEIDGLLAKGWEPFAGGDATLWLRRLLPAVDGDAGERAEQRREYVEQVLRWCEKHASDDTFVTEYEDDLPTKSIRSTMLWLAQELRDAL